MKFPLPANVLLHKIQVPDLRSRKLLQREVIAEDVGAMIQCPSCKNIAHVPGEYKMNSGVSELAIRSCAYGPIATIKTGSIPIPNSRMDEVKTWLPMGYGDIAQVAFTNTPARF